MITDCYVCDRRPPMEGLLACAECWVAFRMSRPAPVLPPEPKTPTPDFTWSVGPYGPSYNPGGF